MDNLFPNDADGCAPMWKKKSIFWDLPYWKDLEVRSAIDVMHVMKNLCVTLLGFLGVHGKTKDTPEAREDQQCMHGKDGIHQGHASYALTKEEKEIFFECLLSMKVPCVEYKGNNKYGREKVAEPKVS